MKLRTSAFAIRPFMVNANAGESPGIHDAVLTPGGVPLDLLVAIAGQCVADTLDSRPAAASR